MIDVRTASASASLVTAGTFFSFAYAGERRALTADLPGSLTVKMVGNTGQEDLLHTSEVVHPFPIESSHTNFHAGFATS